MTAGRLIDNNGYARVRVEAGDWRYEHRAVWESLHGDIPPGYHVHHRNGVRHDNRPENLELHLGTDRNREHTARRHRSGQLNNRGERSGRWLVELDNSEIIRRRDSGESFRSIGRSMGASHQTISTHYRRALEAMA